MLDAFLIGHIDREAGEGVFIPVGIPVDLDILGLYFIFAVKELDRDRLWSLSVLVTCVFPHLNNLKACHILGIGDRSAAFYRIFCRSCVACIAGCLRDRVDDRRIRSDAELIGLKRLFLQKFVRYVKIGKYST